MRIIVTGGAGFIGSHISRELVKQGHEVIVIDNLFAGKIENIKDILPKIRFIKGDIRDLDLLKKEFKNADFVSHQAARRSVPESVENPYEYNDVNINGHLNVLEAARINDIKRIVFASSSSVYGEREDFPEKETDLPNPISPYAITKLAGENYCKMFYELYGLETVSLRYFNVFGPCQDPNSQYTCVIPKFIKAVLNNQQPTIYWDGEQSRDFTYVENNVLANISSFQTNEYLGKNIKAKFELRRKGDVRNTLGDNTKAKRLLGYETKVDFRKGLKRTIEWFKN